MPKSIHGKPYLAFDLGAQSGRAVLAHLQSGILTTEEVHRFPNEPVDYGGSLHWDVPRLWLELRNALSRLGEVELAGIGVDAWGVDYALLGERGDLLENPYHYRDRRTEGIMEDVLGRVSKEEIYNATGIQFMPINTLYQLVAAQRRTPKLLAAAKYLLTIPDLFNYWLTGNATCEFTNATTTQMVDPVKRTWATNLMQRLELPANLPGPIVEPGSILGTLLPEITCHSSYAGATVIAPACHDTGSAVAAISARDGTAFLSSGTWSLLGTELDSPVITPEALRLNFTNEGGVNGTTRLLKNVMGLWMLHGCRQSWTAQGLSYDYRELIELATRQTSVSPPGRSRRRIFPAAERHARVYRQILLANPSAHPEGTRSICPRCSGKSRIQVPPGSAQSGAGDRQTDRANPNHRRRIKESFAEPTDGKRYRKKSPRRPG